MIVKIIGISIITIVSTLILKQYKPEFALVSSMAGGFIILALVIEPAKEIINSLISFNIAGFDAVSFLKPVLKVVLVGLVSEFGASLSIDSGVTFLANKIYLAGKISILIVIIPTLIKSLNLVLGLL